MNEKSRNIIFLIIYLIINDLFILKYVPNIKFGVIFTSLFDLGIVLFFLKNTKFLTRYVTSFWFLLLAIPLILFLWLKVDPYSIKDDRWSALFFWTKNLISGQFPYLARTHLNGYGSPFPAWQLVHIPFYFLGDEIWAHVVIIMLLAIFLQQKIRQYKVNVFVLMLLVSPAFWWEILVRSDLLNSAWLAFLIVLNFQGASTKWKKSVSIVGFVIGLACCTRILILIPLGLYFIPYFINLKNIEKIKFAVSFVIGFLLCFIPLLVWDAHFLLSSPMSPIVLQTRQGSLLIFLSCLVVFIFSSLIWRSFKQYLSLTSTFLFGLIGCMFILSIVKVGIYESFFLDGFDISYFNFALPFVLAGLSYKK